MSASKMRDSELMTLRSCYVREPYVHPAIEGFIFWGIMQGRMWHQNPALLNINSTSNEEGQRFIDLRRSGSMQRDNSNSGVFHGTYVVQLTTPTGTKMLDMENLRRFFPSLSIATLI
ncbi:hypothetical protein PR202_ga17151 [Eleusine coracana subsp. coracana]|uniref:Uncharacterized protein n=1 Tax=Eleusine coracana subsp. coracana TaxID=191504 RepID=A0AAV5CPJ2_ELECO|nr:hypothetical protein PR202_ga17151 [Eleusine coracana subsp. coracana]